MAMYNLTGLQNVTGIDKVMVGMQIAYPGMIQMLLFFEFMVITLFGSYALKRAVGGTQLITWATIGSLVTTTTAMLLYLVPGLVDSWTVGTCIGITIILALLFFVSGKDGDF